MAAPIVRAVPDATLVYEVAAAKAVPTLIRLKPVQVFMLNVPWVAVPVPKVVKPDSKAADAEVKVPLVLFRMRVLVPAPPVIALVSSAVTVTTSLPAPPA